MMSDEESPRSNEDSDINSSPVTSNTCPPTAQQKDISQALFKVPEGFQALLKHLTRELLNAKPKDPYVYIADFLKTKVNDKRNGLLEQEFFNDDNLNIDIKPPMHYLQQTSLTNVTCPSTTVFGTMASEPAAALQASYHGQGEEEKVKRDPGRQPQFVDPLAAPKSSTGRLQDICSKITPSVLEGCGYNFKDDQRSSNRQRPDQGSLWQKRNDLRRS